MRTLMNLGLGCSGCLTIIGLVFTLTIVGADDGERETNAGAIALIAFAVARSLL